MKSWSGGAASALYSLGVSQERYGHQWTVLFPAMAEGRTGSQQAVAQLTVMAVTIAISVVGGLLTGSIMRLVGSVQFRRGDVICPAPARFDDKFSFLLEQEESLPVRAQPQVGRFIPTQIEMNVNVLGRGICRHQLIKWKSQWRIQEGE